MVQFESKLSFQWWCLPACLCLAVCACVHFDTQDISCNSNTHVCAVLGLPPVFGMIPSSRRKIREWITLAR
ncbi:uncharacterized protein B0T23DRAFT_378981 [Neurospora hispaniola]|uniref:Secreted protein n=1 Tax=Neurospora hispaniola TaxID=588809 RepID=A0AAJ0I6Z8_9PEZI|nr:hypothetical protein B0T23DRAFT_378981 [Neurospora hispaniola]